MLFIYTRRTSRRAGMEQNEADLSTDHWIVSHAATEER